MIPHNIPTTQKFLPSGTPNKTERDSDEFLPEWHLGEFCPHIAETVVDKDHSPVLPKKRHPGGELSLSDVKAAAT